MKIAGRTAPGGSTNADIVASTEPAMKIAGRGAAARARRSRARDASTEPAMKIAGRACARRDEALLRAHASTEPAMKIAGRLDAIEDNTTYALELQRSRR